MSLTFNAKQKQVIEEAVRHIKSSTGPQIYEFSGRAGTGKSTVIGEILRRSNVRYEDVIPMSYIGQAAINMRTKGLLRAKTIHSWLYSPVVVEKTDNEGKVIMDPYFNRAVTELQFEPKPVSGRLMLIDEGYTVPEYMRAEIISRGIKIIATGDRAQLPPVAGNPAFLTDPNIIELDEIMRQGAGSDILYLADRALRGLPIHKGQYGNVLVITLDELTDQMIMNSTAVICGTNRTRDYMNHKIRHDLLGITSDLPVYGDRMVCRKNNWNTEVDGINLANGLTGIVTSHPDVTAYQKSSEIFTMDFKPFLLDKPFKSLQCDYKYLKAPHKERLALKNRKYGRGEKFEFGYALTTHMAQGGQYPNGIYISEYMGNIQNNLDYTGITRFEKSMIYVIRGKRYY